MLGIAANKAASIFAPHQIKRLLLITVIGTVSDLKFMQKVFLTLTCLFIFSFAIAQKKHPVFVKASFGSSNIHYYKKADSKFAYGLELETLLPLIPGNANTSRLLLAPHAGIVSTGYDANREMMLIKPFQRHFRMYHFTAHLPLTIASKNFAREDGVAIGAGPYVHYALFGTYKNTEDYPDTKEPIQFGEKANDDRSRIDYGLGLKVMLRMKGGMFGFQYNYGLNNLVPADRADATPQTYVGSTSTGTLTFSGPAKMATRSFLFSMSFELGK